MDRYVRTSCGHNVSNIRPFLTDDKAQHVTSKVHFHISPARKGSGSLGFSSGDHFGLNALLLMLQKSQLTQHVHNTQLNAAFYQYNIYVVRAVKGINSIG
jgi:hypothetical protein